MTAVATPRIDSFRGVEIRLEYTISATRRIGRGLLYSAHCQLFEMAFDSARSGHPFDVSLAKALSQKVGCDLCDVNANVIIGGRNELLTDWISATNRK
jgi:hypothetical protein